MVSVTLYGGLDEIGGNKIIVEGEDDHRICFDFGRRMGYFNRFYDEFLQPRSKSGIRDFVKLGVLPSLDGIYRDFFLNIFSEFSMGEALNQEVIEHAQDYWKSDIESYEEYVEKHGKPFLDAVFVSHAHIDHIQDISYLSPEIPIFCSEETKLLVEVMTDVGKGGCEYEFYRYNEYELSLKNDSFRTMFPGSPQIKKKKYDDTPIKEHDFLPIELTYQKQRPMMRNYTAVEYGEKINIGDMWVTPIETDHSVPGSTAFMVEGEKNLLYTGDIRFHGDEEKTLEHFLNQVDKDIDILIIEGTRVDSQRNVTENDVEIELAKKFNQVKKLIFVDFPWKDLKRFSTILKASEANHRTLVVDPRLAYMLFRFHLEHPSVYPNPRELENVAVYKRRQASMLYSESDYKKIDAGYVDFWGRNRAKKDENLIRVKEKIDEGSANEDEIHAWELAMDHIMNGITAYEIRRSPEDYVLMINFWRMNELFDLGDLKGSHYVKCMCEPFNDEMQVDENKLINWLSHFDIGFDETLDKDGNRMIERSHVSGHASRPELKGMIKKLNPDHIIPVHTENPDEFKNIAKEVDHDIEVMIPKKGVEYEF